MVPFFNPRIDGKTQFLINSSEKSFLRPLLATKYAFTMLLGATVQGKSRRCSQEEKSSHCTRRLYELISFLMWHEAHAQMSLACGNSKISTSQGVLMHLSGHRRHDAIRPRPRPRQPSTATRQLKTRFPTRPRKCQIPHKKAKT